MINETMARRFWPGELAVGKRMRLVNDDGTSSGEWWTVVGIVADSRFTGLDLKPGPQVFISYDQAPSGIITLVLRTAFPVRLAVGATGAEVVRLVLTRALRPVVWGVMSGLGGALLLGQWLQSLLFEVGPTDPVALVTAVGVLVGVALLAALVPAARALRVNPVEVLRVE